MANNPSIRAAHLDGKNSSTLQSIIPAFLWRLSCFFLVLGMSSAGHFALAASNEATVAALDEMLDQIWREPPATVEPLVAKLQANRDRDLAEVGTIGRMWLLHRAQIVTVTPGIVVSPSPSPATQPVLQFWPPADALGKKPVAIQIQITLLRALTQPGQASFQALDQMGAQATGLDRIRAMEAISRYYLDQRSYTEAAQWLADSLQYIKAQPPEYPTPSTVRVRLNELRDAIAQAERKDTYGPLWEAGREADLNIDRGNDDLAENALTRAEKLIAEAPKSQEPLLIQWIAYLRLKTLAQSDETAPFLKKTQNLDTLKSAPWLGEILLWRGDILFSAGKNEEAQAAYERAIQWLEQAGKSIDPTLVIPKRLIDVATPPVDWYKPSHGGGTAINLPGPGSLWHPGTSAWYVPFFLVEAHIKSGLCYLLSDHMDLALAEIEKIKHLDPGDLAQTNKGMPSNYRRFRDGFKEKGLFLSDDERKRVPKNASNALWLIEVTHELERWDAAQTQIERFIQRHRVDGPDALAPALTIAANTREMNGDVRGCEKILRELVEKYPKTPSAARALIRISQITKNIDEEVIPLLERVIKDFPGTFWEEEAESHLADAFFFIAHDQTKAMQLIDKLIREAKSEDRRDLFKSNKEYFQEKITRGSAK